MSQKVIRTAVIMAGGSGERFWPVSRAHHPKQLLHLTRADQTMLEEAVARISELIPPEQVYIQTAEHLRDPIRRAKTGIPDGNVLAEPCRRNTAGCLVWAAAHLHAKYSGAGPVAMAVLTADHKIDKDDAFRATIAAALDCAEAEETLVTIGIPPDRPATGYGYIKAVQGTGRENAAAILRCKVASFKEKPDRRTAEEYLDSGEYYWNSGMFFWKINTFRDELRLASPAHAAAFEEIASAMKTGDMETATRVFEGLENISIDYALMEKAGDVSMVKAIFGWDDVGTWASLARTRETDENGNVLQGAPLVIDCRDSIIYNSESPEDLALGVIGLEGVVVAVTKDGVLVAPKSRAEEVKQIVAELKKRNSSQL
jgi:mannose-1-phosphate guanylyltransferase